MAFVPKRTKDKEPAGYKSLYIKEKLIKEVEKIANYITPVPGGVGPMTVAMLMENIVKAAK